ncbi:hypothetical protein HOLleu_32532 [Holothuria leucospilota]|uniref:Uncharacterized protein n=1 Tax=Holothuria leucospilota TaxID=206669 RepID=A0A9Q1BIU3_HOLLE|nr:hypothetical protein HOLleu_32532 [Holothuria leucospilota]
MNEWPSEPIKEMKDDKEEKLPKLCQNAEVNIMPSTVNIEDCGTWKEVLNVHRKKIYGESCPVLDADKGRDVEQLLLRRVQRESFGEEYTLLQSGKNVPAGSRLANLDPQFDKV